MKRKFITAGLVLLALLASLRWLTRPDRADTPVHLRVLLLDYTVPFENYREHAGFTWLLNHLRVPGPRGAEWLATDYRGYHPDRRDQPERLSPASLVGLDVLMVADTYGVYRDDLKHVAEQRAHRDYNPLVFGGLEMNEAALLVAFVREGGALVTEFNSFCDPTSDSVRSVLEDLHAVRWSGWVGRVFADPYDPEDTPAWLLPEFKRQYPRHVLAHTPQLIFIHRSGRLIAFGADAVDQVTPRVVPTEGGRSRFGLGDQAPPYYYWFPLFTTQRGGEVLARWSFPARDDLRLFLEREGVELEPPALVERVHGGGRVLGLVGEFADLDFTPPPPEEKRSASGSYREALAASTGPNSAPVYWGFFVPVVSVWLREVSAPQSAAD